MALIRQSAARDLRVDFFRGLALWWIYTDHIPGDVLSNYSLRNFAMCDATEVFVLLAGYGAGLAYGMGLGRNGYVSTVADVLRRAWTLYIAHIFLFVLFTAQVTYSATALNRLNYLEETRLDVLGDDPYRSMLEALLLRFQPSLLNILPLYVVLLAFFAATIWMLRWPRLLFGFSLAIYLLVRVTGINLDSWDNGGWFFDPLAWQFLFVIGATAGYSRVNGSWPFPTWWWIKPLAIGITALVAVINITWTIHWFYDPFPPFLAKQLYNHTIDKTNLAPLRLIDFLAIAVTTIAFVKPTSAFLHKSWAWPVILCGQHSLYIFCVGIVLSVLGHFLLAEFYSGIPMQFAVNLVGMGMMIAIAFLLEWYKTASRRPPGSRPGRRPRHAAMHAASSESPQ